MADKPSIKCEIWLLRLAFVSLLVFTVCGIYLLFFPTDLLSDIFGVLLLITLGLGILFGLVTVYSS